MVEPAFLGIPSLVIKASNGERSANLLDEKGKSKREKE